MGSPNFSISTFWLSSLPIGTDSSIMLGMTIMILVIFSCSSVSEASSSARRFAPAATSAFLASASSSLEIRFLEARRSSASCFAFLLSVSSAITSSTRGSFSSWYFFRMFSLTTSGFSLKNLMSIMTSSILLTYMYAALF